MKRLIYGLVVIAVLAGAAALGWSLWQERMAGRLPEGIVSANGRVEANEIDVAAKFAGRVVSIAPQEGDTVEAGAIIARLDESESEAQLRQAEAEAERARQALIAAQAAIESRRSELIYAKQQLERVTTLTRQGFATHEKHELEQQRLTAAAAALRAVEAEAAEAGAAIKAADAAVEHMRAILAEASIKAPIRGRVQYRLVEPGGVVAAGGRIMTLLDLSDVSMIIFLPARDAGRLAIGSEARVVLDAAPDYVFPTIVAFVSAEAQFTPKTVETASEREKLMFRVKLRAPQEVLAKLDDRVKSGLRGIAYVRTDPLAHWPERLAVKVPER